MAVVLVGCVLLAGAIVAGVLGGSRGRQGSGAPSSTSGGMVTNVLSENVLESLLALNTLPVPNTTATMPPAAAAGSSDAEGPMASAADGAAGSSSKTGSTLLDSIKDMLSGGASSMAGAVPDGAVPVRNGWRGIGGSNAVICYPINGTEVVDMTDGKSPCTVIMLTRSGTDPYNIRKIMNITTTKILVGNPIDMPALNATNKIERLFRVYPGGRLDLRSIVCYRGAGQSLDEGRMRLTIGGHAWVDIGGSLTATGYVRAT